MLKLQKNGLAGRLTAWSIFFCLWIALLSSIAAPAFQRTEYYKALSGNNLTHIQEQLERLKESSFVNKPAFEGALQMKYSGIMPGPAKNKLTLFKTGRQQLESAIGRQPENIEFRFLRIIIQENAPKLVKYRDNLEADCQLLRAGYDRLPADVQAVVKDYNKKSKYLNLTVN